MQPEKIVLQSNQFARWLSKRTGVSNKAISSAINIIGKGILDALANGYSFQWRQIGTFEMREQKPRVRYHRKHKERYMAAPSVVVHFKKAPKLNETVRRKAAQVVDDMVKKPTAKVTGKR
jgi:nucleoid DNA-binding protein